MADLAEALGALGIDLVVVSFQQIRGLLDSKGPVGSAPFDPALEAPEALARPRSWGAPGVPVARLPVVVPPGRHRPVTLVDAYAGPLLAFGTALWERWPFDVLHVQSGLPDGLAALALADRLMVPVLVTEHSSTLPDQLTDPAAVAGYSQFLRPDRRIAAVSRGLARAMSGRLGVSPQAITVLPNAVAVDRFDASDGAERDPNELLYVGSRRATKGIETLLRAFAELRPDRPAIRLRLIGDAGAPADEQRWLELAAELRIADSLTIEEPTDRDGVAAALRRAAALIHPSPRETFGTVAAEALASGTPVVAMPAGGVAETVGHSGAHGEVADGNSPTQLAAAIGRLLGRRGSFQPAVLRRHVESTCAAPLVAERTASLYAELIGGRRPAATTAEAGGSPGGGGKFVPPLVVGLDRAAATAAVAALPADLAARLTVVTLVPDRDGFGLEKPGGEAGELPAVERWVEADPDALLRERRAVLGAPFGRRGDESLWRTGLRAPRIVVQRRLLDARREELGRDSVAAAIVGAWRALADAAPARSPVPSIVPLSVADLEASLPALAQGAELAPGSLRWVADRWDAARRP